MAEQENENVRKEEKFDSDKFFKDLGDYLDEKPKNYNSRFQKWFRIFLHGTFTVGTNGVWLMLWTFYVGWKFLNRIDLDDYKETVMVKEEPVTEESSEEGKKPSYE